MKRILCCLVAVVGLVLAPTYASATTWYVSPNGNNTTRSCTDASTTAATNESFAKANIRDAIECLIAAGSNPGDAVMIWGGHTYSDARDVINSTIYNLPSGNATGFSVGSRTAGAGAITIGCKPGTGTCTLKPANNTAAISLTRNVIGNAVIQYLVFQDLAIDSSNNTVVGHNGGAPSIYINSGSNHNRFLRMTVHHQVGDCIEIGNNSVGVNESPYNEVLDSTLHTCGIGGTGATGGVVHDDAYGVYLWTTDTLIDGNTLYNIGGYGIVAYNSRNTIRNNNVGTFGAYYAHTGDSAYGINVSIGSNPSDGSLVYNNVIHDGYANSGGLLLYELSVNVGIYNNTIANNGLEGMALIDYGAAGGSNANIIRNNIIFGNGNGQIVDYGTSIPGALPPIKDHNLETNPTFDSGAYTITCPGSTACDTGITVAAVTVDFLRNARPSGAGYDIGAYEANATGTPVSITTTSLPNGIKTIAYSAPIVITGGTGTYTGCTVSAGSLPTGLSAAMVGSQCVPSGMPSALGTFSFSLHVCDNAGTPSCATQAYSVTISAVCTPGPAGNWTLIDCPGASSSNGTASPVSLAVDSTGADFAACPVVSDLGAAAPTWNDNKANTWTLLTPTTTATFGRLQFYFSHLTSVGAGHTFTANTGGAASFAAFQCLLFSGSVVSPLDSSTGSSTTSSTTSLQPGNMISTRAEELFLQALQIEAVSVTSVTLSDSYVVAQRPVSNFAFGIALGYKPFGSVASSSNPMWSWAPAMGASSVAASFFSTQQPAGVVPLRIKIRRGP
jgi:parallel beta-helix repeat protein